MNTWFRTWGRPEYKEWAHRISQGYELVILRREKNQYLCVKAKLLIKAKGLPVFITLESLYFSQKRNALQKLQDWKI